MNNYFKGIKLPLKHVLKNPNINLPKLTQSIITCNKIRFHSLNLLKLYCLDQYHNTDQVPILDKVFVNACLKTVLYKDNRGTKPKKETQVLKDKLYMFYKEHYQSYQTDKLSGTHLSTILDYMTIEIITMFENNIKQRYTSYVEHFVNHSFSKQEKLKEMKTKEEKIVFLTQLKKIKNDLLSNKITAGEQYRSWIFAMRKEIRPFRPFEKDSLMYDIQVHPQDYFRGMIYMAKQTDHFNVFPLQNKITPTHITIDTTSLVQLLITKQQGKKTDYLKAIKNKQNEIWSFFFNTNKKCFQKNGYHFHHLIKTDGVSCVLIFLHNDKVGRFVPVKTIPSKEKYITDLTDYSSLQNKTIVAIDPNMGDLLYCIDGLDRDRNFLRYTQNQRRKEAKYKKYRNLIQQFKEEKIQGKTVVEHETKMSLYNKKTLDFNQFKEYVKMKNKLNDLLWPFYQKYIFRKLKLNSYFNRLKSEQKLIDRFKKKFGTDIVVCIGDWEQYKNRKYHEPTKGKGFRDLFRKYKIPVYLVDEYRTSKRCSCCQNQSDCKTFKQRNSSRPWNKGEISEVHGLLKCQTCCVLWNRDENSVRNIYRIVQATIAGKERPLYLQRSTNSV